jgi:hypothetical protein
MESSQRFDPIVIENINQVLEDSLIIRNIANSRRELMNRQVAADDVKSQLCDRIIDERNKIPSLREKIAALGVIDPVLHDYILRLEQLRDGIWCSNCNDIKKVPYPPTRPPAQNVKAKVTNLAASSIISPLAFSMSGAETGEECEVECDDSTPLVPKELESGDIYSLFQ